MKKFKIIFHDRSENLCGLEVLHVRADSKEAALDEYFSDEIEDHDEAETAADLFNAGVECEGVLAVETDEGSLITVVEV